MTMTEGTHGSCLCGEVRFRIDGGFDAFFLCHCSRCRKDSGSAHGANLFSATATLEWLAGAEQVQTYRLPGTRHERSFCAQCGAALPGLQAGGTLLVAPAGSLDSAVSLRPTAHICCADRADWDTRLDAVPTFDGLPG